MRPRRIDEFQRGLTGEKLNTMTTAMSLYRAYLPQATQMLLNLRHWLEKTESHAKQAGYDPVVLLDARLFPDQLALVRQVQIACDTAKLTAARLAGVEAPQHEDRERSLEELKARIDAARSFLETVSEADFDAGASKPIVLPFNKERACLGENYVHEFALPNLYFHVTTAYSILRHNGVPLGKQDFIGRLTTQPA